MRLMDISKGIVQKMYDKDLFSQWLGIEVIKVAPGCSELVMQVRNEMCNGFDLAHGGITYSLADSALAFASNGHGRLAMSVETSISHTKPVKSGDVLTCIAKEDHLSDKIGVYHIEIINQHTEKVALFKGTVYRSSKLWQDQE